MKRMILSMMLAVVAVCGWAAPTTQSSAVPLYQEGMGDNKTLKVKLDLVDFGDTVVVYRSGYEELTFIGKNGKFEFELEVDKVTQGMLLQPRILRGDMEDARIYSVPLVGGDIFFEPVFNFADSCVTVGAFYLILFQWKFFSKED